ncbi:MAG: response regulator, partial [Lautropia sp.]|nr:response regulator [Lautropia sp.]
LGTAETADAMPGAFKPIDAKNRIYIVDPPLLAQPAPRRLPPVANGQGAATGTAVPIPRPGATAPPAQAQNGLERLHQRLLIESAPASVLVDAELNILHTTPGAAEFMLHPAGAPSSSLMLNVHPDLRLELRAALLSASETGKPVRVRRIPVTWQRGGLQEQGGVDLGVCPTRDPDSGASLSVVLFEAVALPPASIGSTDRAAAFDLPDLEAKNQRLEDQLHQTITRFDNSTEELRAANAELAALNDALSRATEELATKSEDLQSMNEELIAVSQELKAKVDETGQISDDFQNLSTSGSIVALFLDRGMNVKRFTAAAAGLFGLGAGGPSRTLEDIADQLNHASLSADAAEAVRTLQPVERLVQSNDGRFFLARIQPYRTTRDSIEGAVLNLSDATLLQQARQELLESREVLRLAADSSALYALLVFDADGRITRWNAGAKRMFGYEEGEILGQSFETLADVEERGRGIPQETLRSARDRGSVNGERCYRRKDGSTFRGSYVATALYGDPGRGFVEAVHDLSEVQEARGDRDQLLARERALTLKLDLARRAQDELFDMLASELKRPLSLVQVNADMLVRLPETRGIPVAGKVAESISKAVVNQSHIIDGLRDLSLARSGKLTLQMRSAGLRDLIEEVVNSKKEQAASRSLSLEFVSDGDPLTAVCDPARIQQVARSLIGNAIKFTEHGGVTVRATREAEHARFSVIDSGVGIAPDLLETVFEAYELPATAAPRPKRGLGIGLALVKELVSAHEGRIVAESEGTERGSTFTVWLRLAEPVRDVPSPVEAGPTTADEHNPLRSLRVVLVDDSVDLLTSFGALLTLEGASVDCFDNAEAALARLLRGDVDLLISDLGMPGMNGYELISEVRKQPQLAALPAIALTGYGRTRDPGHAVRSGFNAHTTKPATVEELKNIVALLKSL